MTQPIPEANFQVLMSTFATQAAVSLGQIPNPTTNETTEDLIQAKFAVFIDGTLRLLGSILLKAVIIPLIFLYTLVQVGKGLFRGISRSRGNARGIKLSLG